MKCFNKTKLIFWIKKCKSDKNLFKVPSSKLFVSFRVVTSFLIAIMEPMSGSINNGVANLNIYLYKNKVWKAYILPEFQGGTHLKF